MKLKHYLVLLAFIPAFVYAQDTIVRNFSATVTLSGMTVHSAGKYQGTMLVNDQTGKYRANSVAIGDLVYTNNANSYVVDTVVSSTISSVVVRLRQTAGAATIPNGVGYASKPAKNYGLPFFTPDNQNGISSQLQAIAMSNLVYKIDSLIKSSGVRVDTIQLNGEVVGGIYNTMLDTVNRVRFNTAYNPAADTVGYLRWDSGNGTLSLGLLGGNVSLQLGQEEVHRVRNDAGVGLVDGDIVYISGSQGDRPKVKKADADAEISSSVTFGVATESIASGQDGFVTVSGYVRGVNTNGLIEGGAIWLDTIPGKFTQTKPQAPVHSVLVGYVIKAMNNGTIFVKIQNGYELDELHNVSITNPKNNSIILYDSTAKIWRDTFLATLSGVIAPNVQTSGQVAYFSGNDTLVTDTSFYWNASSGRLGIGTSTPAFKVDVKSNATSSIRLNNVTNGAGAYLLAHNDTTVWSFGANDAFSNLGIYNALLGSYSMHINSTDSKVGIGTTSPQSRLHVAGNVRIDTLTAIPTRIIGADANGVIGEVSNATLTNILPKKALIDTLPVASVTIDANGNTLRMDSMNTLTYMVSTLGGLTKGRTNVTTLLSTPRSDVNTGLIVSPSLGSYLHHTDGTTFGQVYAYNDRAVMNAANSTFVASIIEAEDTRVNITHYKSSGNPGTQIVLTNDTLTISGDSAVIINNVKMPTSAAPSDGKKYAPVWLNGQPSFERRISTTVLTSGAVTATVSLYGSGTPTISNLSAGIYQVTIPAGVDIRGLVVTANNTVLSGSNEFTLIINNAANAIDQWYNVQLYDISTNGFIDQHATSTNHTQSVATNSTTLVFPGMNLFGSTGFRIIMR